jgi:hypothetical protein
VQNHDGGDVVRNLRTDTWCGVVAVVLFAVAGRAWLATRPAQPSAEALDLFQFFFPLYEAMGRALAAGTVPRWNPWIGFGSSAVAEVQAAPFYPLTWAYALLPTGWAMVRIADVHAVIAGLGTFALCRTLGTGTPGAVVAGAAMATGATVTLLTSFPSFLATFAWGPAVLAAARWMADRPDARRTLVLGAALGLQLLAGYPQLHLFTLVLVPLFVLPWSRPWPLRLARTLGCLALAEALAIGIAAVEILPAIAAVGDSIRDAAVLRRDLYALLDVHAAECRTGFALPPPSARVPLFFGPAVPILAIVALVGHGATARGRWPAAFATAGCLVLALAGEGAAPAGLAQWFTGTYKWTFFVGLGLSLLAGLGTDAILRAPIGRTARAAVAVLGIAVLAGIPFTGMARVLGATLLVLVLGEPVILPAMRRVLPLLLIGLVVAGILTGYRSRAVRVGDEPEFFVRHRDAWGWLAERRPEGRTVVLLPPLQASARQGELALVPTVNVYATFTPTRVFRWLEAVGAAARDTAPERAAALLRSLGVRFAITAHDADAWLGRVGATRVLTTAAADVWEDAAALPRAYVAQSVVRAPLDDALAELGRATVASERAGVVEPAEDGAIPVAGTKGEATITHAEATAVAVAVRLDGPGLLVLEDAWSPDWRATVDGRPVVVRHANLLARGVEVPAGVHVVAFRFVPRAFELGAVLSLVALVVVGAAAVVVFRPAGSTGD